MPADALLAECIVGLFDLERAGQRYSAEEFSAALAEKMKEAGARTRVLTEEELTKVRALRGELVSRWWSVPEGGTLEVEFPVISLGVPA